MMEPDRKITIPEGEFTATLNGIDLWFKVAGRGPVCLMPATGWGPDSELYIRSMKPLQRYFTMVYLDPRGTGRSQRAASAKEYTWDHLVADIESLRQHLNQEKVWLMGHSGGGEQVLHYAAAYPHRVNGLVVITTTAVTSGNHRDAIFARMQSRKHEKWFPDVAKAFTGEPPETDEDLAEMMGRIMPLYWADPSRIEAHLEYFENGSTSLVAFHGWNTSRGHPYDLTQDLTKLAAPVLIIAGDKDVITPPGDSLEIHLHVKNSKFLLIEDCGHFPWLEQRKKFLTQVPRFLEALGLR